MLASEYDNGIILCCGESLNTYCRQIMAAMPMTTKLVLNVESAAADSNAHSLTAQDIRFAVHRQDHLTFLNDISRYFFNLILLENHDCLETMINQLLDKLMPGGMMVTLNCDAGLVRQYLPESGWHVVNTMWPDKAMLIRAVSKNAQPKTRKGGRRARLNQL